MDPAYLPHYTLEDWRRWAGDWELIEGVPYAMAPSPTVTHQAVGSALVAQLFGQLGACPRCQVVYETDWEVNEDTVLRPDCMVLCDQRGERVHKPPRLMLEIVSASTAARDEHLKFGIAEREGVPYFVLVYPRWRVAKIFVWREGHYVKSADCAEEAFEFRFGDCRAAVDFTRIWPAGD